MNVLYTSERLREYQTFRVFTVPCRRRDLNVFLGSTVEINSLQRRPLIGQVLVLANISKGLAHVEQLSS
jgi:hypothetical protein